MTNLEAHEKHIFWTGIADLAIVCGFSSALCLGVITIFFPVQLGISIGIAVFSSTLLIYNAAKKYEYRRYCPICKPSNEPQLIVCPHCGEVIHSQIENEQTISEHIHCEESLRIENRPTPA